MRHFYFSINITSYDFLPYYQGRVKDIVVTSDQGLRVQFPAMHLRPFLTRSGISGRFCLQTEQGKFVSIAKIS
ncbi:DUF2835 domain-containing protein [Thalassotalea marina]|uniref:DUF2835 family protein n=1 Tax=Thalassotalea marina TaxID=1673741 RepID=A0A919BI39_9GAMM|nr:DUF2835 domain-containing protein [Thalassotalea marina]GHF93031.1 hypothetical protein GCM10017161_21570 [Thalassotalea marina]